MDDININSSQESLLSQETYNTLMNLLCQDGVQQLVTESDLNDLPEILFDPPQVSPVRSSLPGYADYPGDVGFKVTFGSQYGTPAKHVNWVYNDAEKKLYVRKDVACPISFSTALLLPPGRIVRAMAIYTLPEHSSEVVTRCITHSVHEIENKIFEAEHLIRSNDSSATYLQDFDKRHSVVIPFVNPPSGHDSSTHVYKFACFSSCPGGPNRRPLTLVFTLEENNQVIGRRSVNLKICACPGRDSGILEKSVPSGSSSTKRKMEPSPQVARMPKVPSGSMLPKVSPSKFKPKKKSVEKGKFCIETNSLECYNFLKVMKRLHHVNQKMVGFPDDLKVFFNLLRNSSSSEDERSQDEDNVGGTISQ